jgi:sugar phosphate isomerase/epimerase
VLSTIAINPDELGSDPSVGMDLAVSLGVEELEIRTAYGSNALRLTDDELRQVRRAAEDRGLRIAALASPLWKWCRPDANPGRVDSWGFPTQVPVAERKGWIDRAFVVADLLGTERIRVFSHLRVEPQLTENFDDDPLLLYALERAESSEKKLLLENEPVCTVVEPIPLLDMLRKYNGLALWLDLGNLHEVGHAQADTIRELAPYVEYVHIKDFRFEQDGSRRFCAPGSGEVPYPELIPALDELRPALTYTLETHVRDQPAQALEAGVDFLRGLGVGRI